MVRGADVTHGVTRRNVIGAALVASGMGGWLWQRQASGQSQAGFPATWPGLDQLTYRNVPGNLIFRGTRSLEGRVVRWFDDASDYTHVGVLVPGNALERWQVIHATPDSNAVVCEPISLFLASPGTFAAETFGWRVASSDTGEAVARQAQLWIGKPFDGAFDSEDDDSLYCTELIWKVVQTLGWVGAPELRTLATPLGQKRVITISQLLTRLPIFPTWAARADGPVSDTQPS